MRLDLVLTFIAACIGAIAVTDPVGVPRWVQVVAAVLSVGFAAVGIPARYAVTTGPDNGR